MTIILARAVRLSDKAASVKLENSKLENSILEKQNPQI
jgi:hypothetical protein